MKNQSDIPYWLALAGKERLVPATVIENTFKYFNSIQPLWEETPDYVKQLGFNESELRKFIDFRTRFAFEECSKFQKILLDRGIKVVRYVDDEYPKSLKDFGGYHIKPPLTLLVKGSLQNLNDGAAIVGTRECSFYGHMMARKLAKAIAREGYTVISGLARGVDTEAHCGALEAKKGRTIAALPWLDKIYPEENVRLAEDIAKNGCLVSENYKPPVEYPSQFAKASFVLRNRIISGLARCVILVESGVNGGTFRQATIATDQKRKVFAVKPKNDNKIALEGYKKFLEMGIESIDNARPVIEYLKRYPKQNPEKPIKYFL